MTYNFDELVNRRGTDCCKWDAPHVKDCIPLWIADMDYQAAPCIMDALRKRLEHGVFGYTEVPERYYEAVSSWFANEHGWNGISSSNTLTTIGVVPAVSAILQGLKNLYWKRQNLKCLVQSPDYNCFYSSIANSEYTLIENNLIDKDGHFEIDWEDLEKKMAEADAFILCNPHNPVGRIWTREELTRIAEIADHHHVFVIADEIHCEFVYPGEDAYTPYALVTKNDMLCVCTSCTKAFNLAGLQIANIYVPNEEIRRIVDKQINIVEICDVNPFGIEAMIAAYSPEGKEWLDQMNAYIYKNYQWLNTFLSEHPEMGLRPTRMEGTYLSWLECSASGKTAQELCQMWAEDKRVLLNPGDMYGQCAKYYVRVNLATQLSILQEAFTRLTK